MRPTKKVVMVEDKQSGVTKEFIIGIEIQAEMWEEIDRAELGITTLKSSDGLQSLNEGFDFLQHNDKNGTCLNES